MVCCMVAVKTWRRQATEPLRADSDAHVGRHPDHGLVGGLRLREKAADDDLHKLGAADLALPSDQLLGVRGHMSLLNQEGAHGMGNLCYARHGEAPHRLLGVVTTAYLMMSFPPR
jgi:hypothetical protein